VGLQDLGNWAAYVPIQVGLTLVVALTFLVIAEIPSARRFVAEPAEWRRALRRANGPYRRYTQITSIAFATGWGPTCVAGEPAADAAAPRCGWPGRYGGRWNRAV